jgi:hypothetical protein
LHEGDKTLVVISFQIVDIVNFQYIIGFRASMEVDNWAGEYPGGLMVHQTAALSAIQHLLIIGLPNSSILFALMRHKLSKWPYAELKFPVVSALGCFTYYIPKTILEVAAKKITEELNLFTVKI